MIEYIKYTIDGETYELTNNGDGTWGKAINAPSVKGQYNLLLEIGQEGNKTYIDSTDPRYQFYLEVIEEIERKVDLVKYIAKFMRKSLIINEVFNAENLMLDRLHNDVKNIGLDIFIRTASNEAIIQLENYLRFKGQGTLEQRRAYLLSLFQKNKKLNETLIKEITYTITGSDCIVMFFGSDEIDNPQYGQGLLRVQVLSPDNNKNYRYEDIQRALRPLVPSHIQLSVIKFFATWGDVKGNFADWNAVKTNSSWQDVKNYIPPQ